jgi:hypothetical protein
MQTDFGRGTRRVLRQLANLAWERELNAELRALDTSFAAWKAGDIGPHELSDRIHAFHHGTARALYARYTGIHPPELVARAVGLGILSESDVPSHLLDALAQGIQYYQDEAQAPGDDAESDSAE